MFKDEKGKISFMRIGCGVGLLLGFIVGVFGIIGFMLDKFEAVTVIATSQGLIALVLGAKAWQKTSE